MQPMADNEVMISRDSHAQNITAEESLASEDNFVSTISGETIPDHVENISSHSLVQNSLPEHDQSLNYGVVALTVFELSINDYSDITLGYSFTLNVTAEEGILINQDMVSDETPDNSFVQNKIPVDNISNEENTTPTVFDQNMNDYVEIIESSLFVSNEISDDQNLFSVSVIPENLAIATDEHETQSSQDLLT